MPFLTLFKIEKPNECKENNSFSFFPTEVVTPQDSFEENAPSSNDIMHALAALQKKENTLNHHKNQHNNNDVEKTRIGMPAWKSKKDGGSTTKKESCINKVPYDQCSLEFIKRGTCSPESGFDFFENCQQYCEFCVPDLFGDDVIKTKNNDAENKRVTIKDSSRAVSKTGGSEPYPWDNWKKEDLERIAKDGEQCVNKAPYNMCSLQFIKRGSCQSDDAFNFVKNCQQYCEFCVPDLSG